MLLILLLLLNVFYSNTIVTSLNEEASALLSFKNSIKEDPGGSLINWNSSDQTPCSWNGITCNDKRVISLSLPKSNLHGFLPSSLGSLTQLRHINLRNNRFNGTLPNELVQVQGLQSLVVFGNFLSGSLPNDIGKLKYLQILDLSQNFFNGSLPISIVQCKRLKSLSLSRNNFYGVLPDGFGTNLTRLEKLDLSFNRFSGFIPYDLSNLSSLEGTADLSHNLFSGSIPASLGNLPEKVYIDLTYNNLTGPIPQNGALINRGPTAFLGNSGLCGPPLKNPCSLQIPNHTSPSSSSSSFLPHRNHPENIKSKKPKGMSKLAVIVIVVSDVIGICLIGLLLSHCFCSSLICSYYNKSTDGKGGKRSGKESLLCFRKDDSESTLSENGEEQCDLVALDAQVGFNLDELLKASAFVLGKSGIGIVYRVVLEDGSTLAVRRLGEGGSQRLKEFQTEVEAIGKLRHPNLVTLKAYYWSVDEKLLIYDYIPNGNLALAIHGKVGTTSSTPLSWSDRLKIMKGIAKGLVYLHEFSPKKYVHGDLKPNNILLGENMEAYISDFGLGRLAKIAGGAPPIQSNRTEANEAEILQEKQQKYGIGPNSESCYQAPESLKVVKPSQKWDVYSFGVILLEMISGRSPVIQVGTREMELVHWIQLCIDEERLISDVLDPGLAQNGENEEEEMIAVLKISMACVHSSPEKRPTMKHVSDILERMGT